MVGSGSAATGRWGGVAFGYPDFRRFLLARFFDRLAMEMLITAVSWQVYQLTGNPLHLGLVGLAQFAPFLLLFLVAGAAADRLPRIRIMRGSVVVQLLCAAAFFGMTLTGRVSLRAIFIILVALGIARAFQAPVQQAIVPILVPAEHFANAVAWSSAAFQTARIGGPALAGALLLLGVDVVYGVVTGCVVASLAFVARVRAEAQILSKDPFSWRATLAGLRFIWSRQVVLGAISLDLFAVLLGGATALLPIFAVEILGVGAVGFGVLRSAPVVGSLACMLWLTQRPIRQRAGFKLLAAVAFVRSRHLRLRAVAGLLAVAAGPRRAGSGRCGKRVRSQQPGADGHPRRHAGPGERGELGVHRGIERTRGVRVGGHGRLVGVVPAVLVGGIGTVAIAVAFGFLLPRLRRVDSLDPVALVRDHGGATGASPGRDPAGVDPPA